MGLEGVEGLAALVAGPVISDWGRGFAGGAGEAVADEGVAGEAVPGDAPAGGAPAAAAPPPSSRFRRESMSR